MGRGRRGGGRRERERERVEVGEERGGGEERAGRWGGR